MNDLNEFQQRACIRCGEVVGGLLMPMRKPVEEKP